MITRGCEKRRHHRSGFPIRLERQDFSFVIEFKTVEPLELDGPRVSAMVTPCSFYGCNLRYMKHIGLRQPERLELSQGADRKFRNLV